MEILKHVDIQDSRGANEDLINTLIAAAYEILGHEGMEAIIELGRAEMEETAAAAAATRGDGGGEANDGRRRAPHGRQKETTPITLISA